MYLRRGPAPSQAGSSSKLGFLSWKGTGCSLEWNLIQRKVCVAQFKDWLRAELPLISSEP